MEDNLGLQNLVTSTDSFHLRIWLVDRLIDISANNENAYSGTLTNFAYRELETKKGNSKKIVHKTIAVDTSVSRSIIQLYRLIGNIPTDDLIEGWGVDNSEQKFEVADGYSYLFEQSSPTTYSLKVYGNPRSQYRTVPEARQVTDFVDSVYSKLDLTERYQEFRNCLKPGTYTDGGVLWFIIK